MATRKPAAAAAPLPTRAQWKEWIESQVAINPQFIAPNQLCQEDLDTWKETVQKLNREKFAEHTLREKIFRWFFPLPAEGTNNAQLPDGTVIKGKFPITRNIDQVRLDVLKKSTVGDMRAQLTQLNIDVARAPDVMLVTELLGISVDKLVEYKPSLVTSVYRTLTAEQLAIFEQALEVKPGSFALEIVPPKTPGED